MRALRRRPCPINMRVPCRALRHRSCQGRGITHSIGSRQGHRLVPTAGLRILDARLTSVPELQSTLVNQ